MNTISRIGRRVPTPVVVLVAALLLGACTDDHNEIAKPADNDPVVTGTEPPIPAVRAMVGDRETTLFWDVDDASEVSAYRVYRGVDGGSQSQIGDDVADTIYIDSGLTNSRIYSYRVSSVLQNGLEGELSPQVLVSPGVYGVLIDQGSTETNSVNVQLSFTAPQGTTAMRIGEDADLSGESWRSFSTSISYELTPGDGTRTVYAAFRDPAGNESAVVEDSIVLETGPPSAVPLQGPTAVSETKVNLSWGAASDGDFASYRLYRALEQTVGDTDSLITEITDRQLLSFEDTGLVENTRYWYRLYVVDLADRTTGGAPLSATTANAAPAPVTLGPLTAVSDAGVLVEWSASDAHDFDRYVVYRAESEPVDLTSTRVRNVEEADILSVVDDGLLDNTTYYYRVYVYDTGDSLAASGSESVITDNAPPPPVTLTEASHTSVSVSLTWNPSVVHDFESYRIWRAGQSSPGQFTAVTSISQSETAAYTDFFPSGGDSTLFYKITVYDSVADSTDSNVVSVDLTQ